MATPQEPQQPNEKSQISASDGGIAAGERVRIKSGVLKGVEGIILKRQGKTRVLVSVHFLQQGASVEIEDFQIEPV